MKALLKKDLFVLATQMRFFLILLVVFSLIPAMQMSVFAIVYCGMLPYTSISYDERSKWDSLAAMMPYTTGDIVLSKYLLSWISMGAAVVLNLTMGLILGNFSEYHSLPLAASTVLPAFFLGVLMVSLTLPPMFRFGVEKGRTFFVILMVALAMGSATLAQELSFSGLLSVGIPVLATVVTAISIPLSIKLYPQRQSA